MNDPFVEEQPTKEKSAHIAALKNGLTFDPRKYEYDEQWVPARSDFDVHSTGELVENLLENKRNQIEARVFGVSDGRVKKVKVKREQFLEWARARDSKKLREAGSQYRRMREDFGYTGDPSFSDSGTETIGKSDFTPLLGGPFNRQLYYRDYLRMIATCFYAYHHDPVARAITHITTDFTMGRGFQLHAEKPEAQAWWNAFVEANNYHEQMDMCSTELSFQGEVMWYKLPSRQTRVSFNPVAGEKVPTGLIPRIRLIDPSNIAEIITIPEDIMQGVLYYVWLAPTQYQMYSRDNQPSTKFIYNQIPAEQMMHFKINCASNEKRGRSDFFPALGYMKRLRDGVNYSLVAQQKAAAWCLDTTIDGNQGDIDNYIQAQKDLEDHNGVQTAGSEFVHTPAVKREYLANATTAKGGDSPVFSWCLNMACMAAGIPVNYLGTHLSGGGTRASAVVATEPVIKRFERRQLVLERIVRAHFNWVMQCAGIESKCEIIFPELLTQDRSALFKDLSLAQMNDWIKPSRAAEIVNKELDTKDFNYEEEIQEILKQKNELGIPLAGSNPLTAPGEGGDNGGGSLSSSDRAGIKNDMRQ